MVSKHTISIKIKIHSVSVQFPQNFPTSFKAFKIAIFPVITTLGVPKMLHQILKAILSMKFCFNFFFKNARKPTFI